MAASLKYLLRFTVSLPFIWIVAFLGAFFGEAASAFAEGVVLGTYRFLKYKDEKDKAKLKRVIVVTSGGAT